MSSKTAHPLALAIVGTILDNLNGRGGFDAWWDGIEPSIRKEIRRELVDAVTTKLGSTHG